MEPITLGPLVIRPFGLAFAVMLVPFFFFTARGMRRRGLREGTASWFAVLCIPLSFVLARLGFCLLLTDEFLGSGDYLRIFRFSEGGFLLWGGIGGMLLAAKLTGKITKQDGGLAADATVIPACLFIAALRLLCGLMFSDMGIGMPLESWFDPEEADFTFRFSLWRLEDWSFFERFPFAVMNYYEEWCWAVFVPQSLWAGACALLTRRPAAAPGGRTARFLILFSCGSIVLESMLKGGEIMHLPWLAFVKANQILCAVALLCVAIVCVRRLEKGRRLRSALVFFAQFFAVIGVIIALEFAAFEKKIALLQWLPADGCHLIMIALCVWMALAFRPLWKKAYGAESPRGNNA